jgi:hypothetical protein
MSASQCLQISVLQDQPLASLTEVYLDARVCTSPFYIENHALPKHRVKNTLPQTKPGIIGAPDRLLQSVHQGSGQAAMQSDLFN